MHTNTRTHNQFCWFLFGVEFNCWKFVFSNSIDRSSCHCGDTRMNWTDGKSETFKWPFERFKRSPSVFEIVLKNKVDNTYQNWARTFAAASEGNERNLEVSKFETNLFRMITVISAESIRSRGSEYKKGTSSLHAVTGLAISRESLAYWLRFILSPLSTREEKILCYLFCFFQITDSFSIRSKYIFFPIKWPNYFYSGFVHERCLHSLIRKEWE